MSVYSLIIIIIIINFILLKKTDLLLIGIKYSTQNLLDHNLQLVGCPATSSTVKNLVLY